MGCIDPPCGKLLMEEEEGRLFFIFSPYLSLKVLTGCSPHIQTLLVPLSQLPPLPRCPQIPQGDGEGLLRALVEQSGRAAPSPASWDPPVLPTCIFSLVCPPKQPFSPRGGLRCCLWVGDCQAGPSPREVRGGRVVFLPS